MSPIIEVVPKPMAAVAVFHLGISYGFGSVFAERKADWVHIPKCQVELASAEARTEFSALSEAERKRRIVSGILRQFPGLRELPMLREIGPLLTAPAKSKKASDHASHCVCLADAARQETRWDHMVWVATLRFYTPAGVSRFDGVMTRLHNAGHCSTRRAAQ